MNIKAGIEENDKDLNENEEDIKDKFEKVFNRNKILNTNFRSLAE